MRKLNGPSKNKSIPTKHKIGDIILLKEKNFWNLKQYPKVNGGIVVLDPYRRCKSFGWRFYSKSVSLIYT